MFGLYTIAGTLALAGAVDAAFSGAGYSLNFPDRLNGKADIEHFHTTLVLPKAPQPETNVLALWPGVQSDPGRDGLVGLTQSIAASFGNPQNPAPDGCKGKPGQWCAFTYQFISKAGASQQGTTVAVDAGAHLVIDYAKQGDAYHQTITLNGKVISSMQRDNSGPGYSFYTAVECHAPFNQNAPAHEYLNTTITLSNKQPDFKNFIGKTQVDATPLTTTDGGKTWKVQSIKVHESHCDASGEEPK